MNLIICFTPLQILIAMKVIQREAIDYSSIHFVYFSSIEDDKHKKYFKLIANEAKKSIFIKDTYSFKLICDLRKKFTGTRFDKVLLASIDDSITHYLLSFIKFNNLITFDDGLGNILKTGSYFKEHQRKSFKKRLFTIVHFALGRKYYLDTIKTRSDKHYSIYKDFENCISHPVFIRLFDFPETQVEQTKIINIFLGTVFNEVATSENGHKLKLDVINYIDTFAIKPIYIPHPRALDDEFKPFELISNSIAEEEIFELINAGFKVNLYGFASSCQFNLLAVKNVNVCVLDSPWLTSVMKDAINMLTSTLPEKNHIYL